MIHLFILAVALFTSVSFSSATPNSLSDDCSIMISPSVAASVTNYETSLESTSTVLEPIHTLVVPDPVPAVASSSRRTFNLYFSPLDLVLRKFEDVEVGLDLNPGGLLSLGVAYRTYDNLRQIRVQGELYASGNVFTDSFVWNINYVMRNFEGSSLNTNTYGTMLGHKWFWTDPGQSGMNFAMMFGGEVFDDAYTQSALTSLGLPFLPVIRLDLGFAF